MLQRIQSILLGLVIVFISVLFFIPLARFTFGTEVFVLHLSGITGSELIQSMVAVNTLPLLALVGVIDLLTLVTVFLFKKRVLQIKLNRINVLLNTAFIAMLFLFYIQSLQKNFVWITKDSIIALALPAVNILLLIMASSRIKRDEELVRSADRLR